MDRSTNSYNVFYLYPNASWVGRYCMYKHIYMYNIIHIVKYASV